MILFYGIYFNFKQKIMIKKLLLLTIIFFWFFLNGNVFAEWECNHAGCVDYDWWWNKNDTWDWKDLPWLWTWDEWSSENIKPPYATEDTIKQREIEEAVKKRKADCKASTDCIDQASFTIETWEIFGGISSSKSSWDTNTGTNILLGTIIQKLMVALGILSVLIMTVGGWYIILYHGQDELLSKGKSIFMSWIIALVIALSSYMIVGLLRFILYN